MREAPPHRQAGAVSVQDVELAGVDAKKGIVVRLKHDDAIPEGSETHFQVKDHGGSHLSVRSRPPQVPPDWERMCGAGGAPLHEPAGRAPHPVRPARWWTPRFAPLPTLCVMRTAPPRVHTLSLRSAPQLADVFRGADMEALLTSLSQARLPAPRQRGREIICSPHFEVPSDFPTRRVLQMAVTEADKTPLAQVRAKLTATVRPLPWFEGA